MDWDNVGKHFHWAGDDSWQMPVSGLLDGVPEKDVLQERIQKEVRKAFALMGLGIDIFRDPVPCPKCGRLADSAVVEDVGCCRECERKL
ncbi:unnamed protein product [marine sediment metagenome]|uniref:Uncharacterized protein n=1 Tax=marine sediment metagenome TaxID=412755 RepID=X1TL83_9ZZZZ